MINLNYPRYYQKNENSTYIFKPNNINICTILSISLWMFASIQLTVSCGSSTDNKITPQSTVPNTKDTVKQDVPAEFKTASYDSLYSETVKLMGIKDLRRGSSGLEIRIWLGYALADSSALITIKSENDVWNAILYRYKYHFNDVPVIDSMMKSRFDCIPQSGWKEFSSELNSSGLYDMVDYSLLHKYYTCGDGNGITVEIAKPNLYKTFSYPCYDISSNDKVQEVGKIRDILSLLKKEFELKSFNGK